jgi:N-methylhydantoinase A
MSGYLRRLEAEIARLGIRGPLLLIMSSGGVTTVETAARMPVRLVESGPAGGVIFAQHVAAEAGVERALSIDMGGTTAKLTLIDDLKPQLSRAFEIARQYRFLKGSGLPVRIPVIDMVEIGAGGGSIARLDALGRITVGPDSAGADPGPACYARGGSEATVSDADLVLGRIEAGQFAGGKIPLEPARAEAAVMRAIGDRAGLSPAIAAAGISEIVDETMANAARVHAVENGKDTADRVLIVSGGAAPLHAMRLAEKLGIREVIVPVGAGVGSAHGFLKAPIAYEVVRSRLMSLARFDGARVRSLFAEMRVEAEAVVRLGAPGEPLVETRAAFMRYRGQGHEITVRLPQRELGCDDAAELHRLFEDEYRKVFGRIIPRLEVEALSWTLTLATERPLPARRDDPPPLPPPPPHGQRSLFDATAGRQVVADVYARAALLPGMAVDGPAVIVEEETATVVPPQCCARIAAAGHIVMRYRR